MPRDALATASWIHEVWHLYRISAGRQKHQALGNPADEIDDDDPFVDWILDEPEHDAEEEIGSQLLPDLKTSAMKLAHLDKMKRLIREITIVGSK
jgi:hypothetical protein